MYSLVFCPFCNPKSVLTLIIKKPYATLYWCNSCHNYFFTFNLQTGNARIKVKQAIFAVQVEEVKSYAK
jgi:transcription elongation factor Elf1